MSNKTTITRLQNHTDAVLHDLEPSKAVVSNHHLNHVSKDVKLKSILSEAENINFES